MPAVRSLNDGQVGTTAAALIAGANVPSGYASLILQNTGTTEETVLLTFQRAGGTARRLVRAVLQENEQLLVRNVPMQPDDTLLGVTSTASTVDFLVFGSQGGTLQVEILDAEGTGKGITALRKILAGVEAFLGDQAPLAA